MIKGMPIREVTEFIGRLFSRPGSWDIISASKIMLTPNIALKGIKIKWLYVLV